MSVSYVWPTEFKQGCLCEDEWGVVYWKGQLTAEEKRFSLTQQQPLREAGLLSSSHICGGMLTGPILPRSWAGIHSCSVFIVATAIVKVRRQDFTALLPILQPHCFHFLFHKVPGTLEKEDDLDILSRAGNSIVLYSQHFDQSWVSALTTHSRKTSLRILTSCWLQSHQPCRVRQRSLSGLIFT